MKYLPLTVLCLLPSLAFADDVPAVSSSVSVTLAGSEADAWSHIPSVMEQCVGAATMREDTSICQQLNQFLTAFAARVKAGTPVPVPTPDPSK